MYLMREDILNIYNQRAIAREIGKSYETINRIFKRKQKCSKTLAYCLTKLMNPNCEIEDYFIREEK